MKARGVCSSAVARAALLAFALPLVGCAGERDAGEDHIDSFTRLTVEEDLRFGDLEDPDLGFSAIFGVDVDRAGAIYVLEGLDRQIRVYDETGTLLRRIGGPGEGPGEFGGAPRFGVIGDTVWTYDGDLERITLFDRLGRVLTTGRVVPLRIPLVNGFGYVRPTAMRPDGRFSAGLTMVAGRRRTDPETGVQEGDSIPVPRVLFDATGVVVDTIGWDPSPPPRMVPPPGASEGRWQYVEVGSRRLLVPDPPSVLPLWETPHDGRIIVHAPVATTPEDGAFTVTRLDLAGDTVYHRTFHYTPVAYTAADLDSVAMRAARTGGGFGIPVGQEAPRIPDEVVAANFRAFRDALNFPAFRVPLRSTRLDHDERLWIRRDDPEGADSVRHLILDANGRPVGTVTLPGRVRILWSRGDTFWASVPDELDVPWLVRYRMRE